jgi:hypothetical protein
MDSQRVRSIQEHSDGPMTVTSEQKLLSPEPLFLNTDTMKISLPRVNRSQDGAWSSEDVYQYEFPDDASINPRGQLTSFDGAQVTLFGMMHRMDESFRHHPSVLPRRWQ